jgi:DNA-binding response OmpR family regulator/DnaJ-domain-containing protein 1
MAKKQKILLIEDDKKFGESLVKILTAAGFECMHAEKPQTALSLCKAHSFDVAIVDCMLPQMNGVDLAMKIKDVSGSALSLYMMSGIYKDRNFSVTALKKTGAKSFLIKPFEISVLLEQLKADLDDKKTDIQFSDDPLKNLILQEDLTQQTVIAAIVEKKQVSGFEIPLVISAALAFRVNGRVQLKNSQKAVNLYFSANGLQLAPPQIPEDKLKNFISSHEYIYIEDQLKIRDGQWSLDKICESNFMSPHLAEKTEKEFAIEELNEMISMHQYTIEYFNDPAPENLLTIETKEVDSLLQTWVSQSINPVWLKNYYAPYLNNLLMKLNTTQNKIQSFPLISAHKNILSLMLQPKNIMEIVSESGGEEHITYRVIHLMMLYREFTISLKKASTNAKAQIERLRHLLASFKTQDAFEKLGLTPQATDHDIKKSFQDFSASLHPDKLLDSPEEVRTLSTKVYEQINEAYSSLKTPERRQEYLRQLEHVKQQRSLDAARIVDQGLLLLLRGDISAAEVTLNEAAAISPHFPRLKILQTWCGLKSGKLQPAATVKMLQNLTNDDRETAIYHHVKGLQNLVAGDLEKAAVSFKNAIAKDTNFLPARRELSAMPQQPKKSSGNIFTADLKDVVGLFFKKK